MYTFTESPVCVTADKAGLGQLELLGPAGRHFLTVDCLNFDSSGPTESPRVLDTFFSHRLRPCRGVTFRGSKSNEAWLFAIRRDSADRIHGWKAANNGQLVYLWPPEKTRRAREFPISFSYQSGNTIFVGRAKFFSVHAPISIPTASGRILLVVHQQSTYSPEDDPFGSDLPLFCFSPAHISP